MFRGIYSFFFKKESTILCLTKFKNALITWKKGYPARSKDFRKSAQNPGENKHTLPSYDPQNLPFHRKPGLWANISCKITGFSCVTQDLYKDYLIYLQSKVWVKSLKKVIFTEMVCSTWEVHRSISRISRIFRLQKSKWKSPPFLHPAVGLFHLLWRLVSVSNIRHGPWQHTSSRSPSPQCPGWQQSSFCYFSLSWNDMETHEH